AGANVQYGAPAPAYSAGQAPGASQTNAPSRRDARRADRRSARASQSSGATAFTPGSGPPPYSGATQAYASAGRGQGQWEWYAAPGPSKRGDECITHVDSTRGYGFRGPCKK